MATSIVTGLPLSICVLARGANGGEISPPPMWTAEDCAQYRPCGRRGLYSINSKETQRGETTGAQVASNGVESAEGCAARKY